MKMLKMPRERKERLIANVQAWYENERGEAIGSIAAEQLLDFFLAELGPDLYNLAIQDARKVIGERHLALEDELYALEKPIRG